MYLINPKVFYFMNLIESFETFVSIMIFVSVIFIAALVTCYLFLKQESSGRYGDEDAKEMCVFIESKFKPKLITFFMLLMFSITILIPSNDTMLKMLVASQVTTQNIESVEKTATELIDYIVDKIDESKGD